MHTITVTVPIETQLWYDADGRETLHGCYDAGGHYYIDRELDALQYFSEEPYGT